MANISLKLCLTIAKIKSLKLPSPHEAMTYHYLIQNIC